MLRPSIRHLWWCALMVAPVTWACSSDESPVGPSAAPEQSLTTAVYTAHYLGDLGGGSSEAFGINNAGAVVGSSRVAPYPDPRVHAFIWKNGVMKDLGTLAGANQSQATAINKYGVIVGWSRNSAGDMRAVRWAADGKKRSLGTLGGRNSEARAINEFGVIVGWSETASGRQHAFRWQNGVITDLGTLGGTTSAASAINRGGAIVGVSTTAAGKKHAFKWRDGVMKDLGTMGKEGSAAKAINTKGQIAVGAGPPCCNVSGEDLDVSYGFVFYQDATTPCCRFAKPTVNVHDINANGVVVGSEIDLWDPESVVEDAWIWENGRTQLLPKPPNKDPLDNGDTRANAINSQGDIVGGVGRAVIWKRQ